MIDYTKDKLSILNEYKISEEMITSQKLICKNELNYKVIKNYRFYNDEKIKFYTEFLKSEDLSDNTKQYVENILNSLLVLKNASYVFRCSSCKKVIMLDKFSNKNMVNSKFCCNDCL